ncbi:hypothetical protein D3C84_896680 [compost metagenome]
MQAEPTVEKIAIDVDAALKKIRQERWSLQRTPLPCPLLQPQKKYRWGDLKSLYTSHSRTSAPSLSEKNQGRQQGERLSHHQYHVHLQFLTS